MDYTIEYTTDRKILYDINIIRRYKGVYLPLELVGPTGNIMMDYYIHEDEESLILQDNKEDRANKLTQY